jgi:hypothetical protein
LQGVMADVHDLALRHERRDLCARSLRDMLAARLLCHPRRLGALSPEVVAAMLEAMSGAHGREHARRNVGRRFYPTVVTPTWDSRAG